MAEVKTYDDFLTGEVFGYIVKNVAGAEVESCWGFYGEEDIPYAVDCAKQIIDGMLNAKVVV
jgi:hypothetical protein